jgi:hypothetical protein
MIDTGLVHSLACCNGFAKLHGAIGSGVASSLHVGVYDY